MVAAIVVLYHPDLALLERLIKSALRQVEKMYLIDNTPKQPASIATFLNQFAGSITYTPLGDNTGIAHAQNVGIREAILHGCTHILLLDQDSVPSADMVNHLMNAEAELVQSGAKVAAVGPLISDATTSNPPHAIRFRNLQIRKVPIDPSSSSVVESDCLFASGSLIRTDVIHNVGYMLEELFIDAVDTEWCLRARFGGYKCYIIPSAAMDHSLGYRFANVLGRTFALHNDLRHYYIVRNAAYLLRVKTMGSSWRIITAFRIIPGLVLKYSWSSEHRAKAFLSMLSAICCGAAGKLGRLDG